MSPRRPRDGPQPPAADPVGLAFHLGALFITPGAQAALTPQEVLDALTRHVVCDWGDVGPEDWCANDRSLRENTRLLSAYHNAARVKFWIITEADRSATTVLLPEEY